MEGEKFHLSSLKFWIIPFHFLFLWFLFSFYILSSGILHPSFPRANNLFIQTYLSPSTYLEIANWQNSSIWTNSEAVNNLSEWKYLSRDYSWLDLRKCSLTDVKYLLCIIQYSEKRTLLRKLWCKMSTNLFRQVFKVEKISETSEKYFRTEGKERSQ